MSIHDEIENKFGYLPTFCTFLQRLATDKPYCIMTDIRVGKIAEFFELSLMNITMSEIQKINGIVHVYSGKGTSYRRFAGDTKLLCFNNLDDFVMFKLRFQ